MRPTESRQAVTPSPAENCASETPPVPTEAAACIASALNPVQPGPAGSLQDRTGKGYGSRDRKQEVCREFEGAHLGLGGPIE